MDVSIIIVSYNVKKFIPFCLESIFHLSTSLTYEVIIVDNASQDDSSTFIRSEYPEVQLIQNNTNKGFSVGCNQGALKARGKFLLFLNPDTIVSPDLIDLFYDIAESKKESNAYGAEMFDGSMVYLNESSRSFPTLKSAIMRMLGIDVLFGSKEYYNVRKDTISKVEVLTGAVLFISRTFFNKLDGFSTDYFMYGEDIELCQRISQSGGTCWIVPEGKVVHFKGESARKSYGYYEHFYKSLSIYANKFIYKSNIIRAIVDAFTRVLGVILFVISRIVPFFSDLLFALFSLMSAAVIWSYFYYHNLYYFDWILVSSLSLVYASIIVLFNWVLGNYLIEYKSADNMKLSHIIFITAGVLVISALLPEGYRFSRSALIIGLLVYFILSFGIRRTFNLVPLVFSPEDHETLIKYGFSIHRRDQSLHENDINAAIIDVVGFDPSILLSQVIEKQRSFFYFSKRFKALYNSQNGKVIGRYIDHNSIFKLTDGRSQHQKRVLDIAVSIILSPLILISPLFNNGRILRKNLRDLRKGTITTVGYNYSDSNDLPQLKKSLLFISNLEPSSLAVQETLMYKYALHYSIWMDLSSIGSNFVSLLRSLTTCKEI